MLNFSNKLEINIRKGPTVSTDIIGLGITMVKNRIPAVVIDPEFIEPMFFERQKVNAQYKIITTVDFNNGKQYAMDKLRSIPRFCLESDGFEILVSPNRTDAESKNELKAIYTFLRGINPLIDIRWVLGLRTRSYEDVQNSVAHFKDFPCSFVRTDINVAAPNFTLEKHKQDIEFIKKYYGGQIKISGNVNLEMLKALPNISRFDVSLAQFKNIGKEWKEEEMAAYKAKNPPKAITKEEKKPEEKKPKGKTKEPPKEEPVEAPIQ